MLLLVLLAVCFDQPKIPDNRKLHLSEFEIEAEAFLKASRALHDPNHEIRMYQLSWQVEEEWAAESRDSIHKINKKLADLATAKLDSVVRLRNASKKLVESDEQKYRAAIKKINDLDRRKARLDLILQQLTLECNLEQQEKAVREKAACAIAAAEELVKAYRFGPHR